LVPSDDEVKSAYLAGLTMLARRELSEAQIRQRLRRKKHSLEAIDAAVTRLRSERAIDDARVAAALARTEVGLRRRGRVRVERRIQNAGIQAATARHAVDEVFRDVDGDALLTAALQRRLKGRSRIADQKEFQRLYRYLVAQGFEAEKVLSILRAHSKTSLPDD
jgi:regulatory protein